MLMPPHFLLFHIFFCLFILLLRRPRGSETQSGGWLVKESSFLSKAEQQGGWGRTPALPVPSLQSVSEENKGNQQVNVADTSSGLTVESHQAGTQRGKGPVHDPGCEEKSVEGKGRGRSEGREGVRQVCVWVKESANSPPGSWTWHRKAGKVAYGLWESLGCIAPEYFYSVVNGPTNK